LYDESGKQTAAAPGVPEKLKTFWNDPKAHDLQTEIHLQLSKIK